MASFTSPSTNANTYPNTNTTASTVNQYEEWRNREEELKQKCEEWYRRAQADLKKKIIGNLNKRAAVFTQAINFAFKQLCQDTENNHIWKALHPNHSIDNFNQVWPLFSIPKQTFDAAKLALFKKVGEWPGVDINAMYEPPKCYKRYWRLSKYTSYDLGFVHLHSHYCVLLFW